MARPKKDLQQLCRAHTEAAVRTLIGIMKQPKAGAAARIQAANSVLDRAWGKAAQHVELGATNEFAELMLAINGRSRQDTAIPLIDQKPEKTNGTTKH